MQNLAELSLVFLSIPIIPLSLVGAVDDFFNLEWRIKLFFQILFVTIPIFNLNIFLNIETLFNLDLNNVLNYLGSILWIVLLINSINFIDNMDGVFYARDLVNEPSNVLFPKAYAQRIQKLRQHGLKIEVLGESKMKTLKMYSLVGVGQGSQRESQLVIMHWNGAKAKKNKHMELKP